MTFHFAWVDPSETAFGPEHVRSDEHVYSLEIAQQEGDFATVALEIRNPRAGLLSSGRKRWAWLSWTDDASPTDGATALLFGRLMGVPEDLDGDAIRITLQARPVDFDALKRALADTLKVAPYYDPLWLDETARDDPDAVLEARTQLYHTDRVTHAVTVSDIITGEDGTLDFGAGTVLADSVGVELGQAPARRVRMNAEARWNQTATGTIDITPQLLAAAAAAGTDRNGTITTFTGGPIEDKRGLGGDWPEEGDKIGGGWTFGPCSVERVDGSEWPVFLVTYGFSNGSADYPLWVLRPSLSVAYDVSRQKTERVTFTLEADCQALLTEPGEEEVITVDLSTDDVDQPIDPATTDQPNGQMPIRDARRRAYFPTERGRRSVEYLIALARAQLLARARAVTITFQVPWRDGLAVSCRKNARIVDPHLPGGEATGKIVGYSLSVDGDSGEMVATISIGCTIGKGATVTANDGTPAYVDAGYAETGYQVYSGAIIMPIAGEVTYDDYASVQPVDDGVDFFDMRAADMVETMTVIGGEATQRAIIQAGGSDIAALTSALSEEGAYTEVDCTLKKLTLGSDDAPFVTEYPLTVSALMVPKTLDLEYEVTA